MRADQIVEILLFKPPDNNVVWNDGPHLLIECRYGLLIKQHKKTIDVRTYYQGSNKTIFAIQQRLLIEDTRVLTEKEVFTLQLKDQLFARIFKHA